MLVQEIVATPLSNALYNLNFCSLITGHLAPIEASGLLCLIRAFSALMAILLVCSERLMNQFHTQETSHSSCLQLKILGLPPIEDANHQQHRNRVEDIQSPLIAEQVAFQTLYVLDDPKK